MENLQQAKSRPSGIPPEAGQLISEAKNIYIIPNPDNEPDSAASALALFYTLKDLNKNVNLIIDGLPEKLKFLIPSADFISYPKNFVISIPNSVAEVSQIYYEKNPDNLKIHLTLDRGNVKKDNISFYFSETKPDLIITLGISDYQNALENKLNSFGFLLDSQVLNIDNTSASSVQNNKMFGKINIIESRSIAEITLDLIINPSHDLIKKEPAKCFLTGIVAYTENLSSLKLSPETFETMSMLMKKGADLGEIRENLYK